MKAIIISILLFVTVHAQNIWYINRDATGSNNGTSWTNAWKSFNNINWNNIQAGDTIYVSGGSDSTTYWGGFYGIILGSLSNAVEVANFASGNPLVIAPAYHSGHNGEVYLINPYASGRTVLGIGNISNIKITGMTIYDDRTTPTGIAVMLGNGDWGDMDSLIFFDNMHVIMAGHTGGVGLITKVRVTNSLIEHMLNSNPDDQDMISMQSGRGGHIVDGNTFIYRNINVGTGAHRDMMQISNMGLGEDLGGKYAIERLPVIISNNLFLNEGTVGTTWNAMIYSSGPYCNVSFYVYNNLIISQKAQVNPLGVWIGKGGIYPWTKYKTSLYLLNNTIYLKGVPDGQTWLAAYNHDTLIVKNNIFIYDTTINRIMLSLDGPDGFPYCYKEFDYNYYAVKGGTPPTTFSSDNAVNISWNSWRNSWNRDVNGIFADSDNILFENLFGEFKSDYYTETGREAGVNLSSQYPFLAYDILGNPRTGAWDMGALEYTGSQSNNIRVRSKIYLQGPFNSNLMSTNLTQGSFLPNSQPYNQPPWNYNGNESFNSGPNSTMVDWILVELRSATNPSQVVARRAAILKNDGILLEPNGSDGVLFTNVGPGSYYIAIHHRNHLAIMSAAPVVLSLTSALYDFTTAMNMAYGQNPMVELAAGKYGMYATDGNADGVVNTSDRDNVWLIQNGNMGYLEGDFNMNSGVTVHDVNQLWNINNGKISQVP